MVDLFNEVKVQDISTIDAVGTVEGANFNKKVSSTQVDGKMVVRAEDY